MTDPRDPIADLKRIAFLLEAMREPGYRIRAFRSAATALAGLTPEVVAQRASTGRLRELAGIGEVTERTILESLRGEVPVYLRRLQSTEGRPQAEGAAELRAALKGDLHLHGWVYKIETGEVFAFEPTSGQFVPLAEFTFKEGEETGRRRLVTPI